MDAETAFTIVGKFGKYQFLLAIVLFLGNVIVSQQLLLMVIVGATPNVSIGNEENLTTIVTDFDLYDESWIVDLIQSLLMGGYLIGCTIFGQLSDIYGRRPILVVSSLIGGVVSFCSGLATSWEVFAVTRFLAGFFVGGAGVIMFVLLTELIGKGFWAAAGMTFQMFFSIGVCTLAGLGYGLKKWQTICMVTGGLGVAISLIILILIPESPRWLYSTGKIRKAEVLLQTIARRNGNSSAEIKLSVPTENPSTHSLLDIFRYRKLAIWLCVTAILWFTNGLVYYGLTLSAADLTSSLYVGIVLSGAIEIPANILCIFMMDFKWLGRKRTLWILYALCVCCCVASIFVTEIFSAKLAIGLLNKLAIVGCFNICFVYSSELFPTPLRSVAVGADSTAARFGAVVAPFVPLLGGSNHVFIPFLIFTLVAVISFFVLFLLPRTLGKAVPQTIEEVIGSDEYRYLVNSPGDTNEPTSDSSVFQ